MLGAQTSGTQVKAFRLTIYGYRGWVYVGNPAAVGMPFGMTNIVTEQGGLTTQIALQYNRSFDCRANLM